MIIKERNMAKKSCWNPAGRAQELPLERLAQMLLTKRQQQKGGQQDQSHVQPSRGQDWEAENQTSVVGDTME